MENKRFVCFFLGLFLLFGVADAYYYYVFLRFSVFFSCLFLLYLILKEYRAGQKPNLLATIFILSALVVFNPIMPLRMKKSTWRIFDAAYGICFIYFGVFRAQIKQKKKEEDALQRAKEEDALQRIAELMRLTDVNSELKRLADTYADQQKIVVDYSDLLHMLSFGPKEVDARQELYYGKNN